MHVDYSIHCNSIIRVVYCRNSYQYIKIFVVRLSVTDVGVAIMNLRVVCKITYVSAFTKMAIILG